VVTYTKSSRLLVDLQLIENLYRPLIPPPIKILCYAAIADLFKYLPESKANPQDVVARQKLLLAAWMSLWPIKLERLGFVEVPLIPPKTINLTSSLLIKVRQACRMPWDTGSEPHMGLGMALRR
jgi:hypothetical protein